ncbi:MAG: sigma-70 family RNA polymerase sigma factor [Ruminococcaceae bacterium]|nr:sigma-70 family RNA polymerase sigma factor [Oscillospiraceae bacterium]
MTERERTVCDNMGLVHACARRFIGRGVEYEDLVQAGCVGLVKAVDGFEEERGLRLSTYAVPVILGEIRRLFRDGGAVKVGRTLKELSVRAVREHDRFVAENGREPQINELAQRLGVECAQAAQALGASLPPLSLTRWEGDGDDGDQIDLPVPPPEEQITDRLALRQVLAELDERDRCLIEWRYLRRRTQQVTAEALGMTQVQVSRRERVILKELRRKLTG